MIKAILVATDFSPAAHDATHYGAALALSLNARLIIFHVLPDPPLRITDSIVARDDEEVYLFVQRRLQEEADAIDPVKKIQVETSCRKGGPVHKVILDVAWDKGADIIIAAIKTEERRDALFWPETIAALARSAEMPLLLVPELSRFRPFSAIAIASEEDIAPGVNLHFLDVLRDIISHFNSKVFAVRVMKSGHEKEFERLNRPYHLQTALGLPEMEYACIEGNEISFVLNDYIKDQGVDLLVVFPKKHSMFAKWLFISVTQAVIQRSSVPLLVLSKSGS